MSTTNVDDIYELSPLQQGMLLHTVHDGATDMYLGQHVYIVEGSLDVDAMVRAWRMVFESHPALRTSFHWDGEDKPLQVVHRDVMPPAHQEDWSELGEDRNGNGSTSDGRGPRHRLRRHRGPAAATAPHPSRGRPARAGLDPSPPAPRRLVGPDLHE